MPSTERIAAFDHDGTLWAEQPMYFQFLFALDCVLDAGSTVMSFRVGRSITMRTSQPHDS